MENEEEHIRELEVENRELLLQKSRLETALEEALLKAPTAKEATVKQPVAKKEEISVSKTEGFHVMK